MKYVILIFLMSLAISGNTQPEQSEINEQVWKPFITYFNENNTAGFMSVHSKDVVRSPRDAKKVWNWEDYNKQQGLGDKEDIKEKRKRTLELRFTERIVNKDIAVEVGVYKTSYGENQNYYGRFHVVLKKENGIWKILVDTDSTEGGTIGEKEFLAAQPLQ